ncbi:bacterial regulatory s, tetR family protein [Clostridium argentinense CDC 2741]|uniref:Bacterial regulatory s, tetR family protein n=1 Tax=Clostridium argentinense CDC 2741 TaxID=1418104 RepID=A0A0C1R6W6_9CLOT|nr:bacterial regulatory s, tetR family protein [Clostridium argentinense CDC 2741]
MRLETKGKEPMKKSEANKLEKKKNLMDVAYELFTTKGINDTYISEITKKAGVAKGTFYLYFNDKYHLKHLIILNKSSLVLKEAIEASNKKCFDDLSDEVIFFIDYIINYLKGDKKLLKLIYKNLTWGLYKKALLDENEYQEMNEIYYHFVKKLKKKQNITMDAEKLLFLIIELTGGVCYSSIILEEPAPIESMKPILFESIKKLLN